MEIFKNKNKKIVLENGDRLTREHYLFGLGPLKSEILSSYTGSTFRIINSKFYDFNGKLSVELRYDEKGKCIYTYNEKSNHRSGCKKEYYENGTLKIHEEYSGGGRLISQKCWDEEGNEIKSE